ncbi:DNA repair protein RecO [Algoriphagus hitonicola]|uniref:DNA repair protein RecO n=1 Tax=Algoriphagus hitonicola TaxID=435880 RepID=A0A1I2S334_9BACT|nr:DNA repair protein RecO [Algoriphagus hitonicola]SFG45227.1 DNA replication and repair protein RecO [Algoriphagus hitonicola]
MLKKTEGIVVNSIRYKESSVIVKIFTREIGLKSYVVNGIRTQGSKSKTALFQPMTVLDLVVYDRENQGLHRLSEFKLSRPFQHIPFDFERTGLALFMSEVINRSIYENYQNEELFDFLKRSLFHLDQKEKNIRHFPHVFLIEQAKYLGFGADDPQEYIDESKRLAFTKDEYSKAFEYLRQLMSDSFDCQYKPGLQIRRKLLDYLLEFYNEQLGSNQVWKSMTILRQLMI